MSVVYFDSSAFVKLVIDEDGSDLAAALWDGCDAPISSRLAYPEVRAALSAASRDHRLGPGQLREAESSWERYWAAVWPVEMTADVSDHAGYLAGSHALRGADAVHLASALVLDSRDLLFAVWDGRLRVGAQSVGIRAVPQ